MPTQVIPYARELETAVAAARAGGAVVKDFYERSAASTYHKGDGSPVTDADIAADHVIRDVLRERSPEDAVLTEEGQDDLRRLRQARCWIVDPIDGTEQFIARTGEFDVLVALIEHGRPVAVAGYQPTTATLVTATLGGGAWVQVGEEVRRKVTHDPATGHLRVATSKWFGAPDNAAIMQGVARQLGLPEGAVVVTGFTPRMFLSPRAFDVMVGVRDGEAQDMASEWDFAVADLVISEAGGKVSDLRGSPYRYNKEIPKNVGGLVAAIDPQTHALVLEAVRSVRFAGALP